MNYQHLEDIAKEDAKTRRILEDMRTWPIHRLQALCIDQSDLELVQAIISSKPRQSSCQGQ